MTQNYNIVSDILDIALENYLTTRCPLNVYHALGGDIAMGLLFLLLCYVVKKNKATRG